MQKTLLAILFLVVLVLSAALVRVQSREHQLEERLAAAERARPSRPAAPAATAAPEELPTAPLPRPAATPEPPAKAVSKPAPADPVKPTESRLLSLTFSPSSKTLNPDLNLSEAQKKAIAELRKSTQTQSLELWDRQLVLEAETELAVRRLLDPQQLQAYDAAKAAQSDVQVVLSTPEEPPLPAGRRPGYLGITGTDAEGGGVQVLQVQSGTVAGLSGIRQGDIILEVNGEKVASYGDLAAKVRQNGEGGPVTLRIRRGSSEFYQGAQLGPRPP